MVLYTRADGIKRMLTRTKMPNITPMLAGKTVAALSILLNRIGPDNRFRLVALAPANAKYDIATNAEN